jgi:nucleotide-binding universal stress UspA family protein
MPKILLAVDGSPHALRTAKKLAQNAAWYREPPRVHLLYVHLPVPEVHGLHHVVSREALHRFYKEEGEAALKGCKKLLDRAKISYEAEIDVGQVAETIVSRARKTGCDMIYMGTRGMTAIENMLLGSVATKVLHLSPIPVVLVR